MDTVMIDKEKFDDLVAECAAEIMIKHKDHKSGALLHTMSGMTFAALLRHKIFDDEEQEEN